MLHRSHLRPWLAAAVLAAYFGPRPACAQLGPLPSLTSASIGKPNGVAQLDANGTASSLTVQPAGTLATRTLAQLMADTVSVLDFGAKCDGQTDDSSAITAAMATSLRIAIPSGMTCYGASISQAGISSVFVGPGQIKTSDGNLRGPIVTQMSRPPARVGTPNIVQAFNGDLSHVPLAIEARITGAATLGQPTTSYVFTNEASPIYVSLYNESGWNQGTGGSAPGVGRTGFGEVNLDLTQNGQGDASGLFESITLSGPNKTGATSFLANPAASMLSGAVVAEHAGVYLQGLGDIDLNDNGNDVAAIGSVINLGRTVGTGALGATWIGYRVQSNGSAASDAAFSAAGSYKMLLDAVDAPSAPVVAAVAGQRYYANASQPSPVPFPSSIKLGTEYMDYSTANGWEWVTANGSLSFGTVNNRLSAGTSETNTGIASTALGSGHAVSGTYATALGGYHIATAANATLVGLAAMDHGNIGATCHASGGIGGIQGSAQSCEYTLRAATSSTTGVRLTADGNAVASGGANSVAVPSGSVFGTDITVVARDTAVAGAWAQWRVTGSTLSHDSSGTSYSGPAPSQTSAGAGSTATLALAADTANTCLSLTFQAPNSDAWHVVATVRSTEVQ